MRATIDAIRTGALDSGCDRGKGHADRTDAMRGQRMQQVRIDGYNDPQTRQTFRQKQGENRTPPARTASRATHRQAPESHPPKTGQRLQRKDEGSLRPQALCFFGTVEQPENCRAAARHRSVKGTRIELKARSASKAENSFKSPPAHPCPKNAAGARQAALRAPGAARRHRLRA